MRNHSYEESSAYRLISLQIMIKLTRTRFETEAQGDSEMDYSICLHSWWLEGFTLWFLCLKLDYENVSYSIDICVTTLNRRDFYSRKTASFNLAFITQEPEVRIPITQGIVGHVATTGRECKSYLK